MISINREALSPELIELIEPMIEENHKETGHFEELNLDWDSYLLLGDAVNVFMVQEERFCGLMIVYIGPYPHNKGQLYAEQLTYYLKPNMRKYSYMVLQYVEAYVKSLGAEFVIQTARVDTGFANNLPKLGYDPFDIRFVKRLI